MSEARTDGCPADTPMGSCVPRCGDPRCGEIAGTRTDGFWDAEAREAAEKVGDNSSIVAYEVPAILAAPVPFVERMIEDERAKALGERRTPDMTWAVIDSLRERSAAALPEVARFTLADIEDAAQALPTGTWPDQSAQHAVLLDQIRDLDAAGRKLAEAAEAYFEARDFGTTEDCDKARSALYRAAADSPWGAS